MSVGDRVPDLLDGEDRSDRDEGIARRDHDQVCRAKRLEHAGRRLCGLRALEANAGHLVPVPAPDEPVLERELARVGLDECPQPVVRRRENRRLDAERAGQPAGDRRERLTLAQPLRPDEMQPEIPVAELEPRLATEIADRLEGVPGLVGSPPASFLVVQVGERVEDRVEVGRDVEAEHLEVVADVPDHRHARGIHGVDEAAHEPRATDAAAQDDDVHDRSCSNSATVSTSSASAGTSSVTTSTPCEAACARNRSALPGP